MRVRLGYGVSNNLLKSLHLVNVKTEQYNNITTY